MASEVNLMVSLNYLRKSVALINFVDNHKNLKYKVLNENLSFK